MSCFHWTFGQHNSQYFLKAWILDQIITVDIHCGSYTLEHVVWSCDPTVSHGKVNTNQHAWTYSKKHHLASSCVKHMCTNLYLTVRPQNQRWPNSIPVAGYLLHHGHLSEMSTWGCGIVSGHSLSHPCTMVFCSGTSYTQNLEVNSWCKWS